MLKDTRLAWYLKKMIQEDVSKALQENLILAQGHDYDCGVGGRIDGYVTPFPVKP